MESLAGKLKKFLEDGQSLVLEDPSWPLEWKEQLAGIACSWINNNDRSVLIPTSGTTGIPKYCIHTADTLKCTAAGYAQRFGKGGIIHSVNVLPLNHVGGLMPLVRSMECSGLVHYADYRDAEGIRAAPFPLGEASISVVPTQLRRMLQEKAGADVLRLFGLVFVGGAACPPELLDAARRESIRLSPCYGSTETAAMITALDPEEFLNGRNGVGTALPHARIKVDNARRISVESDAVTLGYLPELRQFSRKPFFTGDLGSIEEKGYLHISGRADRVIITGGKKVDPARVEEAAVATGLVQRARCYGIPDPDWGMRVALDVVADTAGDRHPDHRLASLLKEHLPAYAVPKEIRIVDSLPAGK